MKSLRLLFCFLFIAVLHPAHAEGGDDARVQRQVHDFFQWYCHLLEHGNDTNIARQHRKEMSRYVAANLLAKLARKSADSQEGDYFMGSLDSDPAWEKNIAVSNVVVGKKGGATAEVLLTGKEAGNVHAQVTLVLEGGTYKIADVEPIPDFAAMEGAQLKMFYEQYLRFLANHVGDETPLSHQDVKDGLTADGLKKATAAAGAKADYFTQAEGWDQAYEQQVEIRNAEVSQDGSHGTAEVLLTSKTTPATRVRVSLKHAGDTFKIDGVEKINE